MDLLELEASTTPANAVTGSIKTADGATLRFARFPTDAPRRFGTICLLIGRGEAIEVYDEVIGELVRRGFAVASFDWRGTGRAPQRLADRRLCHIDEFAEYDTDLEAFMRQIVLPDCPPPYYVLAHDMGGLAALRAARAGRTWFQRMVLTAPMLGLPRGRIGAPLTRLLSGTAAAFGFGQRPAPGYGGEALDAMPYAANPFTSDPVRFTRMVEIANRREISGQGGPTIGWLYAALSAMAEAAEPDFAPSISVPVLMVVASQDRLVSIGAIERLSREMRAGAHVVVSGARHAVMQERDDLRELFFSAFDAFVPGSAIAR